MVSVLPKAKCVTTRHALKNLFSLLGHARQGNKHYFQESPQHDHPPKNQCSRCASLADFFGLAPDTGSWCFYILPERKEIFW